MIVGAYRHLRRGLDAWSLVTLLLAGALLLPLFAVVLGMAEAGPHWSHITSTVLGTYLSNTVIIVVLVTALAAVFGIPTAWLVSNYDFPGKPIFEWMLILPLAIPTYIGAFVYFQLTEAAIPLLIAIRNSWGLDAFRLAESCLRYGVLSFLMTSVLYPYIYISARASFSQQRRQVIEAAQTLGHGSWSVFFRIALPMSRPMLMAGAGLVMMEVVNDYGAVHFFGVPTLTEGIFRTWFGQGDRASALRIAGLIMVVIFVILLLEKGLRGRARFIEAGNQSAVGSTRKLGLRKGLLATLICLIPVALGFIIPMIQLSIWAFQTWDRVYEVEFVNHLFNTLTLAMLTAGVLTLITLLMAYAAKHQSAKWLRGVNSFASLGYATPGAVVALGVMVIFGGFDNKFGASGLWSWMPAISGTLFAIGSAYCVRFLAVSLHPIQGGLNRVCGSLDEASLCLGRGKFETLLRVNAPLLRGTLWAAFTLVFVDILKELPLTMILRPANFETMATVSFRMAMEGRVHECALPALIIMGSGAVGLVLVNRFLLGQNR